jgi:hypothetical protein
MSPAESRPGARRNVMIVGVSPAATALARALEGAGWNRPPAQEVVAIDEDLSRPVRMGHAPLARLEPGARVQASLDQARRIAGLAAREPFVLEDPRLLLTLPAWRPLIGSDCAFVCVFEDPARAASHVARLADEVRYDGALARLTELYRGVLEHLAHAGHWIFTDPSTMRERAGKARLAAFLGTRQEELDVVLLAQPSLHESIRPVPAATLRTFAELCARAAIPARDRIPAA